MIIRFKDVNGYTREHDIGFDDLELWLRGYTNEYRYPVSDLEIVGVE